MHSADVTIRLLIKGNNGWQADQCDAHQLEPFKLALVKTELKLCVGRRLLSRV
jgi:hypothetical protein